MRVEDLQSPPKPGKLYDVLCVRRGGRHIPVLAGPHTDPELENFPSHYHVDIRFLSDDTSRWAFGVDATTFDPMGGTGITSVPTFEDDSQNVFTRIPMRCIRTVPDFHAPRTLENGTLYRLVIKDATTQGRLEDLYEDRRLTDCKRCPHHGTPLGNQPITNGQVTCPAHLLKWDLESGKLCRKTFKNYGQYFQV